MHRRTIFNTPVITRFFYFVSLLGLRAAGWKIKGTPGEKSRFLLIAYPHTSNWDAPLTLAICLVYRLQLFWLCKASFFRGPLGPVMRWLGAIPVPLGSSHNLVQQMIDAFAEEEELIIMIAPEGDRSYVHRWKTGFYHIAAGAGVPIVLGYLDFAKKEGGYLKEHYPSGDIDKDIALIQAEYRGMKGKYPDQSA